MSRKCSTCQHTKRAEIDRPSDASPTTRGASCDDVNGLEPHRSILDCLVKQDKRVDEAEGYGGHLRGRCLSCISMAAFCQPPVQPGSGPQLESGTTSARQHDARSGAMIATIRASEFSRTYWPAKVPDGSLEQ